MRVYRIEHKIDGTGPFYQRRHYDIEMYDARCVVAGRHLPPTHDRLLHRRWASLVDSGESRRYVFAFVTFEQVKAMVGDVWDVFGKYYSLVTYDTDEFIVGAEQVVFVKDSATIIEDLSHLITA